MSLFLMCLKIFGARIIDVSMGTIRTVFIVKGKTLISTMIAFFEVLIWFWVAKEALYTEAKSIFIPIAYSAGYAAGNFIGLIISKKFINQYVCVQIITTKESEPLIDAIKKEGYGASVLELKKDKNGQTKDMIYVQTKSNDLEDLKKVVNNFDEKAFVIINETKHVNNGYIK